MHHLIPLMCTCGLLMSDGRIRCFANGAWNAPYAPLTVTMSQIIIFMSLLALDVFAMVHRMHPTGQASNVPYAGQSNLTNM